MRKDQKLLNFRQEVGSTSSSRGRPARHISECFRTIAWYHFLAAGRSATDVANLTPFDGVDLVTIYRYRRGQRSPKPEFLDADDEFLAMFMRSGHLGSLCGTPCGAVSHQPICEWPTD